MIVYETVISARIAWPLPGHLGQMATSDNWLPHIETLSQMATTQDKPLASSYLRQTVEHTPICVQVPCSIPGCRTQLNQPAQKREVSFHICMARLGLQARSRLTPQVTSLQHGQRGPPHTGFSSRLLVITAMLLLIALRLASANLKQATPVHETHSVKLETER